MDLSTFYIALVFLAPAALAFTLLSAMAFPLDRAGFAAAKEKATSAAKTKLVIGTARDDIGCYA